MRLLFLGVTFFMTALIGACGGGGGGSSTSPGAGNGSGSTVSGARLTLSENEIAILGVQGMNSGASGEITGRVEGMTTSAYIHVDYTENGIISYADLFVEGTSGVLQIEMIDPLILDPNVYVDTITVSVCEDFDCTRHISGSPSQIQVSYRISENPATWGDQPLVQNVDLAYEFDTPEQVDEWQFTSLNNLGSSNIRHNADSGMLELNPDSWGGDNTVSVELADRNIDFKGGTVRGEIHLDERYLTTEQLVFSLYFESEGVPGSSWQDNQSWEYSIYYSTYDAVDGVIYFSVTLPQEHSGEQGVRRFGLRILGDELLSGAANHPVSIDNIEISTLLDVELGSPVNGNGDFEMEQPRTLEPLGDTPDSWVVELLFQAEANFSIVAEGANGTDRAIAIDVISGDNMEATFWEIQTIQENVSVEPSVEYIYSAWIKSSEPARARIEVGEPAEFGYAPITYAEVHTTTEWQQVMLRFSYSAGSQVRLPTQFSYTGNAGVTFYLDEVELRPIIASP